MNTISTYSPICSYAHNITAVEGNTMIYELLDFWSVSVH